MVKQNGEREGKEVCILIMVATVSRPDFLRYPQVKFWDKIKFSLCLFLVLSLVSFTSKRPDNLAIGLPTAPRSQLVCDLLK